MRSVPSFYISASPTRPCDTDRSRWSFLIVQSIVDPSCAPRGGGRWNYIYEAPARCPPHPKTRPRRLAPHTHKPGQDRPIWCDITILGPLVYAMMVCVSPPQYLPPPHFKAPFVGVRSAIWTLTDAPNAANEPARPVLLQPDGKPASIITLILCRARLSAFSRKKKTSWGGRVIDCHFQ